MVVALLLAWFTAHAHAAPAASIGALSRVQDLLTTRLRDGRIARDEVLPAIVVSTRPEYAETAEWYPTEALSTLIDVFGEGGLRVCEACMAPRTSAADGSLTWQAGPVSLSDVAHLDAQHRGKGMAARTAVWLDETPAGVSVRIVDLRTSTAVFAQNIDPEMVEETRSQRRYRESDELDRRARGVGLTHTFVDLAAYPKMHVAVEFTDQWGKRNNNLTGISISAAAPLVGIGVVHYRSLPAGNILVGAKLLVSAPNAIIRRFEVDAADFGLEEMDPLFTGVGVVRVPFGRSNYAALFTASTTGAVGIGMTLLNLRLIPESR